MGPFQQQVEAVYLLDERASDKRFVSTALAVHDEIGSFMDQVVSRGCTSCCSSRIPKVRKRVSHSTWRRCRVSASCSPAPLFSPLRPGTSAVGWGHARTGSFVMDLTIPLDPLDFATQAYTEIVAWWYGHWRNLFVHEFAHYLDAQRNPAMFKGAPDRMKLDKADPKVQTAMMQDYYNSPQELQAYYIQTIQPLYDVVSSIVRKARSAAQYEDGPVMVEMIVAAQKTIGRTPLEFFKIFRGQAEILGYWQHLTRDNQKRQAKRATTTYWEMRDIFDGVFPERWQQMTKAMADRWARENYGAV